MTTPSVEDLRIAHNRIIQLHSTTSPSTSHRLSLHLIQILLPTLETPVHVQILDSLIREPPQFLFPDFPQDRLQSLLQNPPANDLCLKFLFSFHDFSVLFSRISISHLRILGRDMPPVKSGNDFSDQENFISGFSKIFSSLSQSQINEISSLFQQSKRNHEFSLLKEKIVGIPMSFINHFREVFRLSVDDIAAFKNWICDLNQQSRFAILLLLQMEHVDICTIKRLFGSSNVSLPKSDDTSFNTTGDANDPTFPTDLNISTGFFDDLLTNFTGDSILDISLGDSFSVWSQALRGSTGLSNPLGPVPTQIPQANNNITDSPNRFLPQDGVIVPGVLPSVPVQNPQFSASHRALRIRRQPPSETVYQRILKPNPSIGLEGEQSKNMKENLYVEAIAIRSDTEDEVENVLDGTKTVQIRNNQAHFTKLKLTQTSQMKGTFFRLKFLLKLYDGQEFQQEGTFVISNPIEVFSHSQYLTSGNSKNPAPPIVKEVLPPCGNSNCRVVILGNNFIKNSKLVVRFGTVAVTPEFHEQGTLICNAPNCPPGTVPISVANDSVHYCKTNVNFTFK